MDETLNPILIRVDPRLPRVWGELVSYLERAIIESGCGRDWHTEDVFRMCCNGQCALWALVEDGEYFGACVTTVAQYPRRSVMDVLLVGAEPHSEESWFRCLEQLKAIAKLSGLTAMTGTGRPGWFRKLGADRKRIIIEMDI
jgi:hypothetical protein